MKIDKSTTPIPSPASSDSSARAATPKTTSSAAPQEGVNVSLGAATSQLRSMESSMASAPLVDVKKVAEIKQAISEGRFQINSAAVAGRLINNVRDLISASQR